MNWKTILLMIGPWLTMAGMAKKAEDTNDTGQDDIIGNTLVYIGSLCTALVAGRPLPVAPKHLQPLEQKQQLTS